MKYWRRYYEGEEEMPQYLYRCEECEEEFEIICKMDDRLKQVCPKCSAPPEKVKRLINTNLEPNFSWSQWRSGVSGNE